MSRMERTFTGKLGTEKDLAKRRRRCDTTSNMALDRTRSAVDNSNRGMGGVGLYDNKSNEVPTI